MGIKFSRVGLVVACVCLLFFGSSLRMQGALDEEISSEESSSYILEIDNSDGNVATFSGSGSVNVSGSAPAISVTGEEDLTGTNLLTLRFNNDPNVSETDIRDAAGNEVSAHVYARNATNDQSAIGVLLPPAANLTVDAQREGPESQAKYRPTIAARSNVLAGSGVASGAAVGILAAVENTAQQKSTLAFAVPASIYGWSSVTNAVGSHSAYSAASAIGAAIGSNGSSSSISLTALETTFGANNTLNAISSATGNSYAYSAASATGAAIGWNGNGSAINLTALETTFGAGNTLNAISSATSSSGINGANSAANITGVAIGSNGNVTAENKDNPINLTALAATFGVGNTLSATSTATNTGTTGANSAANITGAAIGWNGCSSGGGSGTSTINLTALAATFGVGNTLSAISSATNTSSSIYSANSAASAIGAAIGWNGGSGSGGSGNNSSAITLTALAATFGAGNTLSATSTATNTGSFVGAYSAASAIGAAIGLNGDGAITLTALAATFGANNTLSATSTATNTGSSSGYNAYSAASAIGAAVGSNGSGTINLDGLAATFGAGNALSAISSATNTATSSSSNAYSAASAIGAAVGNGSATARKVSVNLNGSQVLGALAHAQKGNALQPGNAKVNTFGADKTDKGDGAYGWRVGIFAAGSEIVEEGNTVAEAVSGNSTVNILGAKLGKAIEFSGGKASLTLGADQGKVYAAVGDGYSAGQNSYARAFALGEDFKIHVGGRTSKAKANTWNNFGFDSVAPAANTANVVNILGAIAKGKSSANTTGSSLTVDDGWTVNAYGPVDGLANITVHENGRLNTHSSVRNITINGGVVYAHGASDGIGRLEVRRGRLHLVDPTDEAADGFNAAIADIAGKLEYTDPATNTVYKGSEEKIAIDAADYPWKGAAGQAELVLRSGDQLIVHVDTSQTDYSSTAIADYYGDEFEQSNGYVYLDGESSISFQGGRIRVVNDDPRNEGVLPANSDFWIIRMPDGTNVREKLGLSDDDLEPIPNRPGVSRIIFGSGANSQASEGIYSVMHGLRNPDDYSVLKDDVALDVCIFESEELPNLGGGGAPGGSNGVAVISGDSPVVPVPNPYAQDHASAEMAAISVHAASLIWDAIVSRLSDVKNNGTGPFAYAVGSHVHQGEIAGFGYSHDMYGCVLGADRRWNADDKRYTRFGGLAGYVKGDTHFFGTASGRKKTAKYDMYMGALFGACECFNDRGLKTNFNASIGFGYGSHKLHRVSGSGDAFSADLKSRNLFLNAELIKNVCQCNGYQFGLWAKADYNHIRQGSYVESTTNPGRVGVDHVSKVNHDFLDTILGLSIEKEFASTSRLDRKLALALRAGWQCCLVRKHSSAEVSIEGIAASGPFAPVFGYPARNSAVVMANFIWKLNSHWNIQGAWSGSFSKDVACNRGICGVEYDF
ncbi:MAG: autotransporter outer membrane beta-barrel domain-containing protein [Puniceicoccales bacterium]|jgi:hypothetical protein|nr:autotransporter outer membrane beta-barrel domain-containing protein [Puniceicoccales bacterium]